MTATRTGRGARQAAASLGPVSGEEATVDQVVMFVHDRACGRTSPAHDPLCNTMRLLAQDHAHLVAQNARRWRLRGVPPETEQGATV